MDNDVYKELIRCIELDRIILYKLNCEVNDEVFERELGQGKVNFRPTFNLLSKKQNKIKVEANFFVKVFEEETEKLVFNIDCTFLLFYKIKEQFSDDSLIKEFVDRNVRLNAWPYGREIISSITSRMGLPPLTIGLFRVF